MQVDKRHQVWLLGGLFLLTLSVAQAKKPDSDDAYYPDESSQGRQARDDGRDYRRDTDNGNARDDRRSNGRDKYPANERSRNDRRDNPPSRYEQPSQRYEPRNQDSPSNDAPPQSRGKGLSEAVSEAERRTGGRVLSAEPREENGELYYRVKVLTPNGRVQILYLDAR